MKAKFCVDCACWLYQESVAGICYGSCENEDSEFSWQIVQEDSMCDSFVVDEFAYEEQDYE